MDDIVLMLKKNVYFCKEKPNRNIWTRLSCLFWIMEKMSPILEFLSRHKYLLTTVVGFVVVGFADANSIYRRIVLQYEIMDLKNEIEIYNKIYKNDARQLHALERNPKNIERIARERYFMKADDEDIYVLSTDPRSVTDEMPQGQKRNEPAE